jgi:hypothetical protein
MCSRFVILSSGPAEIGIRFTGNTFQTVAETEDFKSKDSKWTLEGRPARTVSGSFYRALEGERTDPRGNTLAVTVAMIERVGKSCSTRPRLRLEKRFTQLLKVFVSPARTEVLILVNY